MSLVITLDGPGGSGKSEITRLCTEALGGLWLNSGQAYRLLTWTALQKGWDGTEEDLVSFFPCLLEKGQLQWKPCRHQVVCGLSSSESLPFPEDQPRIESAIGVLARQLCVRDFINSSLRDLSFETPYFFFEGRDMGSVVFPNADLKIFLTASLKERARRRFKQRPSGQSLEEIQVKLAQRDWDDAHRSIGALVQPAGCWVCDSSNFSLEETVQAILDHIRSGLGGHFSSS
ncbi:(d)CMP kinase [Candidatus Similichlamydia laticola]|uniref:(d)CMP kinase n=1 Tax=Candidatus Similichlamydia laticola TaxID=2170265 RepID=A0A369KL62_9BACT|nr:(d)CMP kinase [Candidatus Similichlamydia laticola]RDB31756.1 Cytidylate kinase [Candidatus Similichlamydia laticola]